MMMTKIAVRGAYSYVLEPKIEEDIFQRFNKVIFNCKRHGIMYLE